MSRAGATCIARLAGCGVVRGGPRPSLPLLLLARSIAQSTTSRNINQRSRPADKTPLPSIAELLKEGQEIIVQIAKEPLGQKGARITSHIALPGRYIVYMPTLDHMGVSRKIASEEERQRLKRILQKHKAGVSGGFIIRTAGEGRTEAEIAADMNFLANLWLDIRQKAERRPAPYAAPSRSRHRPARAAGSTERELQGDLGRQRGSVRERAALSAAIPAGDGGRE